jgi:hypothetical protein
MNSFAKQFIIFSLAILACITAWIIGFAMGADTKGHQVRYTYQDEPPGISGTVDSPTVCVAYATYGSNVLTIDYPKQMPNTPDTSIKVVQWPADFDHMMLETGEIHSAMSFKRFKDTLRVAFDQQ